MKIATFREMTAGEREILSRLLDRDVAGRDALRAQVAHAVVRSLDDEGSIELRSEARTTPPAGDRVRSEGWYRDDDGIVVHLLLHVVDGKAAELEIYKDDGSRIQRPPSAPILELSPRPGGSGRSQ